MVVGGGVVFGVVECFSSSFDCLLIGCLVVVVWWFSISVLYVFRCYVASCYDLCLDFIDFILTLLVNGCWLSFFCLKKYLAKGGACCRFVC